MVQIWPFFQLLFLGKIGQENVFYDILERKNAFLGQKKQKFKKSKNSHFSKGDNPWFWTINSHFSIFFFFGNIAKENVPYDILERKNAFIGYKKKKVQKTRKIDIFSKGLIHGFGLKMAIFPTFFFRQYRPAKRLLRYSRTKKHLFRL